MVLNLIIIASILCGIVFLGYVLGAFVCKNNKYPLGMSNNGKFFGVI